MAFKLTPDVHVNRDPAGRIRQLSHPKKPYRPDLSGFPAASVGPLTPRQLADQYVRDVSALLELAPTATANFAAAPSASPTQAGSELRFKEEKTVGSTATVAYDQTQFGLPLWNAGVSVRVNTASMAVTGAHNATDADVDVRLPSANAPYAPNALELGKLRTALGLSGQDTPTINATRLLIYRYVPQERLDSQARAHERPSESTGLGTPNAFPTLPLPPVPGDIVPDRHYVVTEALFTLPYPEWGTLNWRAFIEPDGGAVLYLRALVSCAATAATFRTDPISATGDVLSDTDPTATLDAIRTTAPVLGLLPSTGSQRLRGEFVELREVDLPARALPAEGSPFAFVYSCKTDDFAACSAYVHCDAVFRAIHDMGIDVQQYFNNTDFPVPVDPHALAGRVNAQARGNAMGNGMGSFVFGATSDGGSMGIAADVRVVLHEFGHALLWDHVSSPNFGFAHSAGDSLAAILHDPESRAPDRFETFPFMKESAGLSRRHDRSIASGWAWFGPSWDDQYQGEQVLSTTLFRIYRAVGGDSADLAERTFAARYTAFLIISGIGLLSFTTDDPDIYVSALIEADATTPSFETVPGGALGKVIRWSFEKQGLYQPPGAPQPVNGEGQPPEVDVFIDDGRHGDYMPFLADAFGRAEIWNRTAADGQTAHQAPDVGVPNFAYVAVQNRGTTAAAGVIVHGFKSRTQNAAVWPNDWKPLTTPTIAPTGSIGPGGKLIVGPFEWTPQFAGETLLFSVSAPGDTSNIETLQPGPIPNRRFVPLDNNVAQRTL